MAGLGLDSIYEDEDAAEKKPVLKTTSQENAPSANPSGAVAPPSAAPSTAPAVARPPTVEQAAKEGGKVVKDVFGYLNPIHLKEGVKEFKTYEDVDPYATGAHGIADLTALYGLKKIAQGVGEGVSSRISNMIKGVDPTIKAQIEQSDKALQMKYGQQQGKLNPVATPVGRVEPTFSPELFAPQAGPVAPTTEVAPTAVAPTEPAPVAEKPIEPVKPTPQEEIQQLKLKQEQIKTDRLEREHQNWVAKNTLSESEQAFGRKAKDATELRLMDTAYKQQQQKASTFNQGPALKSELPSTQPSFTTSTQAPNVTTSLPAIQQQAVAPTPVQPANVVSTGSTPEAAAAPIVKAEEIKKVTQPTEKPASKVKKPIDPSEVGLTKEQIGMKRYLESNYGGGEVGAKTYSKVGEILGYTPAYEPGKGGGLNPEENKIIKGYRKENIAGPKVNLDKEMKRAFKGGAGVAALMALPGFADAAQRKDYGRMVDIASDFAVLPFAGSTELGVSTLGEKQRQAFENAKKLGSPYRSVPPR